MEGGEEGKNRPVWDVIFKVVRLEEIATELSEGFLIVPWPRPVLPAIIPTCRFAHCPQDRVPGLVPAVFRGQLQGGGASGGESQALQATRYGLRITGGLRDSLVG